MNARFDVKHFKQLFEISDKFKQIILLLKVVRRHRGKFCLGLKNSLGSLFVKIYFTPKVKSASLPGCAWYRWGCSDWDEAASKSGKAFLQEPQNPSSQSPSTVQLEKRFWDFID